MSQTDPLRTVSSRGLSQLTASPRDQASQRSSLALLSAGRPLRRETHARPTPRAAASCAWGMVDRDDILQRVRDITLMDTSNMSDAAIVLIINEGMQEISLASEWPWLEASSNISAVDSQQNYALPADFNFAVALIDDDNDMTIPYISPSDFFQRYGNDTGNEGTTPNAWTIWDGDIWLSPIPSTNDTDRFTLYYYKTVTTLSAGSSVPAFHAAFHPMLVEYCKWKLFDREEYFDQSERAFITFARYLSQMITWYARRAKRTPYIAGDGDFHRSPYDPNIPFLRQV